MLNELLDKTLALIALVPIGTNEWHRLQAAFEALKNEDFARAESLIKSVNETMG